MNPRFIAMAVGIGCITGACFSLKTALICVGVFCIFAAI